MSLSVVVAVAAFDFALLSILAPSTILSSSFLIQLAVMIQADSKISIVRLVRRHLRGHEYKA